MNTVKTSLTRTCGNRLGTSVLTEVRVIQKLKSQGIPSPAIVLTTRCGRHHPRRRRSLTCSGPTLQVQQPAC